MPKRVRLPILDQREVASHHFELVLPRVAPFEDPKPGQFVGIACNKEESLDPLLRRPFSFYRVDDDSFRIIYRVVGRGTALLSQLKPGETVDVLGPLGNGYTIQPAQGGRVLLVGGGVGVPPLFHLSQQLTQHHIPFEVLVGFATKDFIIGVDDWKEMGVDPSVATDDGSAGHRGLVTELLRKALADDVRAVYACGPRPMLAAVTDIATKAGIDVYVSMEEWMGCGVGVCLSCVCRLRRDEGTEWVRICYEGPVFDGRKVVWSNNGA